MARRRSPGKRIKGLEADMPVLDAARRVLDIRLGAVESLIRPAAEHADEDVEHIHRLRVATRRAEAALSLFRPCIKRRRFRKTRRRLRRIRRASGAARICDVHRVTFEAWRGAAPAVSAPLFESLLAWNASARRTAQESVVKAASKLPPARLAKGRRKLISSLKWRGGGETEEPDAGGDRTSPATFAELARTTLPPIAAAFREAGAADLTLLSRLHALRIAGKRLRYALEIFAPCLGDEARPLTAQVKSLQDELGEINDAHEILLRVAGFIETDEAVAHGPRGHDTRREVAAALLKRLHHDRDARVEAFLAHWREGRWRPLLRLFSDEPSAARRTPAAAGDAAPDRPNGQADPVDDVLVTAPSDESTP